MIVWVCSYPRSGNTLTRIILKRCFGVSSYTVYDPSRPGRLPHITGTEPFEGTIDELLATARSAEAPVFVKTHELDAPPDEKVIYVVRDGRAAMASFRNYQKTYNAVNLELEELALGAQSGSSWTEHVLWGASRNPETTLVLRYEELCRADSALLDKIAGFTGLPVTNAMDVSFAQLRAQLPEFFTTGSNATGAAEFERTCPATFWLANGDAMRRHGYTDGERAFSPQLSADAMQEMRAFAMRQRGQLHKLGHNDKKSRPAERVNLRP